jgi:hypothetical protein
MKETYPEADPKKKKPDRLRKHFDVVLRFPIEFDHPPTIYPNAPTDEIERRVMKFLERRLIMPTDGKR